jgi:TonB family protein
MKPLNLTLFSAAAMALLPVSAGAEDPAPVTIEAQLPTFSAWSGRFNSELNRQLELAHYRFTAQDHDGIVAIKFLCSESGAPADVSIAKSSGFHDLDAAALQSVRRISTMHPLPAGILHTQQYVALVNFATSDDRAERQMVAIARQVKARNGWFKDRGLETALIIAPSWSGARGR